MTRRPRQPDDDDAIQCLRPEQGDESLVRGGNLATARL